MENVDWQDKVYSDKHDIVSTPLAHTNYCFSDLHKATVDADWLIEIRKSFSNNRMTGYLNIDSARNKILNLCEITAETPLGIFCIYETKLDQCFPSAPFHKEKNHFPHLNIFFLSRDCLSRRNDVTSDIGNPNRTLDKTFILKKTWT